jgi:hypothetical protein
MPRAPLLAIPPERQSSRKRANVNYDEASTYATLPIRTTQDDVKQIPISDVLVEDYDSDDNVVEPETDDEDDSQFRSRPKLAPSNVQKWKLAELMRR